MDSVVWNTHNKHQNPFSMGSGLENVQIPGLGGLRRACGRIAEELRKNCGRIAEELRKNCGRIAAEVQQPPVACIAEHPSATPVTLTIHPLYTHYTSNPRTCTFSSPVRPENVFRSLLCAAPQPQNLRNTIVKTHDSLRFSAIPCDPQAFTGNPT